MAVLFDAVGPSSAGAGVLSGNSLSWTHTAGAGCSHVLVACAVGGTPVADPTATYGGVAMTLLGRQNSANSTSGFAALFVLNNPPAGASTVVLTPASSGKTMNAGSVSVTGGGALGTVFKNFGAVQASSSLAVTGTTSGGLVIDAMASGAVTTYTATGSGQTLRWQKSGDSNSGAGNGCGSTSPSTGGTVTMSYTFTNDDWGLVAVEVLPAAAPNPAPQSFFPPGLFLGPTSQPKPWPGTFDDRVMPVIRSYAVGSKSAAGQPSFTVPKPAGLAVGDYLLVLQYGDADDVPASMTAPSGFGQLSAQAANSANNSPGVKAWGIVATATEVAASQFTFNSTTASDGTGIAVALQAGTYNVGTPAVFSAWTVQARIAAMAQTAPTTTGVANGLLLSTFGTDCNGTAEAYPTATLLTQVQAGALYSMSAVYVETIPAAGATGTRTVTPTPAGITVNGWIAAEVVLPPPTATATYIKTGGCGGGSGMGGAKVVTGAGITPVGSMAGVADTTAALTFPITTTAIGNAVLVGIRANSATATVTGLSGGGCTWTNLGRFGSAARGRCYEVWLGTVTSTVTGATVTATWSADMSAKVLSYFPQEFTLGMAATWAQDGAAGTSETSSTTTTLPWPSVTAAGAGEL